jgi:hypothetical protein
LRAARRLLKAAVMRTLVVAGSLVGSLLASASIAHAEPLRFGPDSPPYVSPYVSAKTDNDRVYDRGWKQCDPGGGQFTTHAPMLQWDVTTKMELRIRLEEKSGYPSGSNGIIVLPGGGYVCADKHAEFWANDWPQGHYQLYLGSSSIGVGAQVRFENPVRSKALLAAAIAKLPTVKLGDAPTNPRFDAVPATVSADFIEAAPTCAKEHQRVMPLAKVVVERASSWFVDSTGQNLFILGADGKCYLPQEVAAVPAGTHTLWAIVGDQAAATFPLEIDDRGADVKYPEAAPRDTGTLDDPLVIDGKVRATERWSSRPGVCHDTGRAPDFYLTSDKPLQKVTVSLLWSRTPQSLHIYGPVGEHGDLRCKEAGGNSEHSFEVFEGRYAVWVGGAEKAKDSDYHVLVMRAGTKIDPMATLVPVPAELTLADRAYSHHYPYFRAEGLASWTKMFTLAPDQLFAYPRVAVGDIPAGEPLIVWSSNDTRTSVIRNDGTHVDIDTRLMTTERPSAIVLETSPRLPEVHDYRDAMKYAGPEDDKAIDAYQKLANKIESCVGDYLAKHDPTWGHGGQLYKISGDKVVNVGDQVAAAGERACGYSRVEGAQKQLAKQLEKTRVARWKAHLAAVRKRFGL